MILVCFSKLITAYIYYMCMFGCICVCYFLKLTSLHDFTPSAISVSDTVRAVGRLLLKCCKLWWVKAPCCAGAALHRMFPYKTIHISTARCLWWIRMSSPLCEGGTSPAVRGRVKSWVTSQQQSPGQHLHSDRLKKDKVPHCSTSCITSADPAAFCCCAADYAALISLPSNSELQSELLGCSS